MSNVFMVTSTADAKGDIEKRINELYPANSERSIQVGEASWLISEEEILLPKSVFDKLNSGESTVFISRINNYYGIHSNTIWDWLQSKGI
jgi:hypothetical protein